MSKLIDLFGEEWYDLLKDFLESEDFKDIGRFLMKERRLGKDITPKIEDMFNAFKLCPLHKMHTIFMAMDVYYQRIDKHNYVSDGLAFSSKYSAKIPKSLERIYNSIENELYDGFNIDLTNTFHLKKWAEQGILLINCGLSTEVGKAGAHILMWEPFITYLLKKINEKRDSLFISLMGRDAQRHQMLFTNPTYEIHTCEHPIAGSYKQRDWNTNGLFTKLTNFQKTKNNIEIIW